MTDAIEIDRLTRIYTYAPRPGARREKTTVLALDDVCLSVAKGEIIGLLGPNGAGKTTLINILATVLLPNRGTVRVLGFDVTTHAMPIRERIGIVFGGELGLYRRLTVRDNLDYWAAMYHVPRRERHDRLDWLLGKVGLADHAQTPVDRLSKGMKQRMHLARGLVNDPELIILDEPTSGMDPVSGREFRQLVDGLRRDGRTILLATHDMSEAEELCDRVVLIDHGRIRGIEDPKAVGHWLASYERVEARGASAALIEQIAALAGVGTVEDLGDGWRRIHTTAADASAAILKLLVDSGVTSLRTSVPSLEEVYLHIIGDRGFSL
ncbi:MAG TPA: ABC transporter ATP-binding protein [Streptosporangiaceae bacterium]|nr:ABC transporter ATP-binding protein [Streptosporangiaceae bacterium]